MKRTDGDIINYGRTGPCRRGPRHRRPAWAIIALGLGCTPVATAGPIRIWSAAVVVDDHILLGDIADLQHLGSDEQSKLAAVKIADAPAPGGSRVLRLEAVREGLAAAGINMAQVTIGGATECAVTRPGIAPPQSSTDKTRSSSVMENGATRAKGQRAAPNGEPRRQADKPGSVRSAGGRLPALVLEPSESAERDVETPAEMPTDTLRQAVIEHFNGELARYGGTAEIAFDQASEQVLDLSAPTYEFRIRRRGGPQLGLLTLEIDVLSDGRTLQTVPLVVRLELRRPVVVARRTINQGATIGPADLERISLTFSRLDDLGIDDTALAVGQRARRVVPAGAMIEPSLLEQVPLVLRGQLVTVTSVAGSIRVVTAAKATQEGRYGDVIKVRCTDETQAEIDGMVTGPGEVRIGSRALRQGGEARLASGGGS